MLANSSNKNWIMKSDVLFSSKRCKNQDLSWTSQWNSMKENKGVSWLIDRENCGFQGGFFLITKWKKVSLLCELNELRTTEGWKMLVEYLYWQLLEQKWNFDLLIIAGDFPIAYIWLI